MGRFAGHRSKTSDAKEFLGLYLEPLFWALVLHSTCRECRIAQPHHTALCRHSTVAVNSCPPLRQQAAYRIY